MHKMKTVLFAGLMPAASLAALTRGMAQAHSHRECHWDNPPSRLSLGPLKTASANPRCCPNYRICSDSGPQRFTLGVRQREMPILQPFVFSRDRKLQI